MRLDVGRQRRPHGIKLLVQQCLMIFQASVNFRLVLSAVFLKRTVDQLLAKVRSDKKGGCGT